MMKAEKKVSFEEAMNQLEAIVTRLEAGDVPLEEALEQFKVCLLYTSPSPRDRTRSRMPSSA